MSKDIDSQRIANAQIYVRAFEKEMHLGGTANVIAVGLKFSGYNNEAPEYTEDYKLLHNRECSLVYRIAEKFSEFGFGGYDFECVNLDGSPTLNAYEARCFDIDDAKEVLDHLVSEGFQGKHMAMRNFKQLKAKETELGIERY